jgi:hypothetical protein
LTRVSYEKTKNSIIKRTSISQKTTTLISDDIMNILNLKDKNNIFQEDDDDSESNDVVHQIKIVVELLKYYCKYKEVRNSSEITIEVIEQNY